MDAVRREVADLARSQQGVATRPQLLRLGITDRQVEGWIRRGELVRLHRGVFGIGPITTPHTHEMAAVMACGASAVVSHRSAVYLYELLPYPARPRPVHVTVPGRHVSSCSGLVVHETGRLARYEVRERHEVPVTAPVRTLIDFARSCTDEELERAVAEAFAVRLTQCGPVLRELAKRQGRPGTARLRTLLDGDGPRRTRSTPERMLLRALRAAGLPDPLTNHPIGKWEVDSYWPQSSFVVEVDAYSTHSSPWAFERDRRKTADLEELGLQVHRVTTLRIETEIDVVVAEIRRRIMRTACFPP